ncbi:hypothetical protein THRCLA_07297 [Thraustotheca clavata]|uniref:DUF4042 domain-containing protein n=1 Tax=Thraustotheca clavata TaxID=74557 RepID=A0A1V9ZES6_9STRA|nr:hypothetical protein THRCLA_07297 [Thraustotheca clavata]
MDPWKMLKDRISTMNSYLQLKCRSEQQVMNDLSRCVAAKDVKKLGGLLHELSFFYVSVVADGDGYIHDTVLKDLTAILMLVKKEDQKIVRLVEVLLQRIAEQMLHTIGNAKSNHAMRAASTPRGDNTGAIMVQLAALMDIVAKYEISHALQPRRVAAYKLYVVLCNALQQPERCFSLVSGIPASSAWTMLALSGTLKKKGSDKELPAQLALLNASFQIARSLVATSPNLLEPLLPQLVAGAFIPNRHAAAACLALFDITPLKVIDALMAHVSPASVSINTTDPLAACYILKLCGKIVRLPVGNRKSSTTATNLLDFSFDTKPIKREEKVPVGPAIEQHVSNRIQDLLLDVCTQRNPFSLGDPSSNSPLSNCSILLTAIEEMTLGQIAPKCFEKVRGGHSAFEIAANGIYKIMQTHANNPIVLHRVCRAIQSVAASFDLTLVEFSDHHLDFFSKITDMVWDISVSIESYHPCLIKESLIALVWLLPRSIASSPTRTQAKSPLPTPWAELLPQLLQLTYVSNVERYDILQALYRRATHFDIDVSLLTHAMTILLHWYQTSPCQWHGDMFLMLWQSMFTSDKCFRSFANPTDIFQSILTVMDHHKAHDDFGLQAVQYTKCIAISFISSTKVLADPSFTSSCVDVILRLAKFAMTEDWPVRRTSIQALIDLFDLCQINPIATEHLHAILFGLKDKAPMQGYCDILYPNHKQIHII